MYLSAPSSMHDLGRYIMGTFQSYGGCDRRTGIFVFIYEKSITVCLQRHKIEGAEEDYQVNAGGLITK